VAITEIYPYWLVCTFTLNENPVAQWFFMFCVQKLKFLINSMFRY